MYTIITKIKYEYAHRLIHHQGKCRHVHGHSGEATIELAADILNDNGFVMDFSDIKSPLKKWLNQHWDHAYLANENDPLLPTLREHGMRIFTFPAEPSAEVMAKYLFEQVSNLKLRPGVKVVRVIVQETCTGLAVYE
jgi:6-pyruvoyltetrahydropterin/6-carboxytetrahydropterin synthase